MRRHLLPSLLLVPTLALAACGDAADATSPDAMASTAPTSAPAATSAPVEGTTGAADECSAAGMTVDGATFERLPDEARATAELLLDAAVRCDEQVLATAAAESDTTLTFGGADPYEFFGLPDDDDRVYWVIATLLTQTPYAAEADDATPATFVWPRVHTGDWADVDDAWQEVVDAGLLPADEAADMRAGGAGYLGWRLGISGDGSFQFLVAGD